MAKKQYYKLYWSTKQPEPKEKVMNRYNKVKNGAGVKGAVIGALGTGALLTVDESERDIGWIRIISVYDYDPVPKSWVEKMQDKPVQDWEWWVDETALSDLQAPGTDLVLEVRIHPDMTYEVKKKS